MRLTTMKRSQQRGNTLVGIIIGLVIGLSIAVVVALVINKAATPFTNKNAKSEKTDVPVAQMQDPNKPLYGSKDAVAQAAKEVAASKAAEAAGVLKALDPAANPANVPVSAASTAVAAPVVPAVAEDKFIYHLQIGAFKEVADAEAARAKLALIGIEASLTEKSGDGGSLHRVRVGPFDSDAMNKMRARLSENGVESVIVRSAK